MRAIQFVRIGEVVHTEVPKPTIGAGQVLVRVAAVGVCQTDIHMRRSTERMIPDGIVLGHEIAGDVVERADDVQRVDLVP